MHLLLVVSNMFWIITPGDDDPGLLETTTYGQWCFLLFDEIQPMVACWFGAFSGLDSWNLWKGLGNLGCNPKPLNAPNQQFITISWEMMEVWYVFSRIHWSFGVVSRFLLTPGWWYQLDNRPVAQDGRPSWKHHSIPGDSSRDLFIFYLEVTIHLWRSHLTIPKKITKNCQVGEFFSIDLPEGVASRSCCSLRIQIPPDFS